jgi:general secretion pathway protein E
MAKKILGEILVDQKLITPAQLQECEQEHQTTGKEFNTCLLEKQFITPQELAQAYASYAGLEFISSVTDDMADVSLLAPIPLPFLRANVVMPIRRDGELLVLTANPTNFQPLDELNVLLDKRARYAVAPSTVISEAINRYYPLEGSKQMMQELEEEDKELEEVELAQVEEKDIVAMAAEAPIIKLVNHILYQAVKRDASDIHIEPYEKEVIVRYRIDGVLYPVMTPPKRLQGALVSRIKIMANLNIAEKRLPQDGRIDIKVGGKPIDIRVSILPVTFGERVVMRLLDKSRSFASLADLGLSERDNKIVQKAITKPNGIMYITGPTGSGKTSTLYSILLKLNKPEVNIVTVEDPVEYQIAGIGQVQVKDKVGVTFASTLRSILRQDPDIIMIGETRDQETAQIAIQAALTGHLVLSTLHTNSAPATITRLLDMGIEPFLIASSLILAIAQRLVRKLCSYCKRPYTPLEEQYVLVGITAEEAKKITFYEAVGCQECNYTGYKGRLAIFEVMTITDGIARLIMERADTSQIKKQALVDGMHLLIQDGVRRVKEGVTTIEEIISVATITEDS